MKEKKNFNYAYVILVILCLGVFMPNYAQFQISAFGSAMMTEENLTPTQYGTIATAPLLPGIFISLLSGLLVDRFGTRKVLTASAIITSAAVVLRVFAKGFWSLYFTMFFIGVFATCLNANSGKILGQWFSPEKMGVGMGCVMALSSGGMALGTGTASLYSGMEGAFIGAAVVAVITLLAWIFLMRDKKEQGGMTEETASLAEGLKVAIKSRTVWISALCMALTCAAFSATANYLPACLTSRGIEEGTANVITMAMTLGNLAGCLSSPSVFRRFKRQYLFFFIHGAVAAFGMFFAWRLSDNPVILFILMFLTGMGCNGFAPIVMSMPVQDEKIGTKFGGTAGGLLATLQLGGAVIIPTYIIAPIATRADGTANYSVMFSLFGVLILMFLVVALFLPNKTKSRRS